MLPELSMAVIAIAVFFAFPTQLAFFTQMAVMGLFVVSLSLVLGRAGIHTLGHAAFLGSGAYAAGLFAIHVSDDALMGLAVGGVAGAVVAAISGFLVLRTSGLTLLMLTIAASQILFEVANQASWLTGGDNGLNGTSPRALFGQFEFDIFGRTAFLYVTAVLLVCYFLVRKLMASPFGLTLQGIHSDPERMKALGCDVFRHNFVVYVIGGLFAGIAGALFSQTVGVVGLSTLSFVVASDALIMLTIGGLFRLPGAVFGTVIFMTIHKVASDVSPHNWMFAIGFLLIICVLLMPRGVVGLWDDLTSRYRSARRGV